jgi:hypothetical protein
MFGKNISENNMVYKTKIKVVFPVCKNRKGTAASGPFIVRLIKSVHGFNFFF